MTLTLLLDLDDTLLETHMESFIPAYFQALGGALDEHVPAETLLKRLMHGTHQMMANDRPDRTLRETFDANFYPHLDAERDALQPKIEQFYDEVFPTLQKLTRQKPAATELVEWAFEQGYRVAIATNPLFPRKAIYHRLRWAGLPPEQYPFEVISSYETFHFTKPNPAYFAEVLGRLGWPDGPVVLVGDDPELDLSPAQRLGLPSFWISAPDAALPDGRRPTGRGALADLRAWLETVDEERLQPQYQSPDAIVATFMSTPAALSGLLSPVPVSHWTRCPEPDTWCVTEILCHLRDVEREVNLPRIQTLLDEDNPFIAGQDTDVWAAERGYAQQDGEAALRDFVATRMRTLEILKKLDDAAWRRPARHAIFGPITLQEQVGFMAEHDRVHVRQVYETLRQITG
ncbi:MAG: HAD hydrolase-like protein [Chloroflexi bacterium]|nr:HAD hydrolase-like protein [Chloroflexota bacterium]